LYTGLFITAHDAMHGTLAPGSRSLNDGIGALCAWLYALFSFRRLAVAHQRHHETPAVPGDPDWHDGRDAAFWPWYVAFMRRYVTWRQLAGMALAFQVLAWGLQIPLINLAVFWIAPNLLSTLQLFYFGTYRVHREPPSGHTNRHRATSSGYPLWLSFLTCYHFGLHLAHHEHPGVPWWRLPRAVEEAEISS
ncbi:MAG: fatty acid desaturase, partial [Candidatus Sericytochromatia bacterium]